MDYYNLFTIDVTGALNNTLKNFNEALLDSTKNNVPKRVDFYLADTSSLTIGTIGAGTIKRGSCFSNDGSRIPIANNTGATMVYTFDTTQSDSGKPSFNLATDLIFSCTGTVHACLYF